jgi:hypothetical protein
MRTMYVPGSELTYTAVYGVKVKQLLLVGQILLL